MKVKKILAQTLAVAMVLSSVPVADFTALAAEDVVTYGNDDVSTLDATETDALPAPYGYENLPLVVGENVTVTTTTGTASSETTVDTDILTNSGFLAINGNESDGVWINFRFTEPQKVAGVLEYVGDQHNGAIKFARVEVKTKDSDAYQVVYENETAWQKLVNNVALFTPVQNVTDVKVYGIDCYFLNSNITNYIQVHRMRIATVPEDASFVTATAATSDGELGTVTVNDNKALSNTQVQVLSGVPVKYQATATAAGEFVEWRDASGKIVSKDATYTTTVTEDTKLTAIFREAYYEKIDQSVLKANAKANSYANIDNGSTTHDLPASAAFDGNESTLWHQNYDGSNGQGSKDKPSASNPIWIQTSFGTENGVNKEETVGCLTYRGRVNGSANTRISDYVILAANKETGSPEAGDWAVVKAGTMSSNISAGNDVDTITFTPVKATHIRLVALSGYDSANFVCAGEINLYRVNEAYSAGSKLEKMGEIENVENGSVTILPPGYETTSDANTDAAEGESASVVGRYISGKVRNITLCATPADGYEFKGWQKDGTVASINARFLTNTDEYSDYTPVFATTSTSQYVEVTGIRQDHVRANSYANNEADGPAWYAFNGETGNWWHSFYQNAGGYNGSYNADTSYGQPTTRNKVWIEAAFGEKETAVTTKNIRQLTYTPRLNNNAPLCNAKDYEILVANTTKLKPDDKDFLVVYQGQFPDTVGEKTVTLPYTIKATHVRLQVSSVYTNHNNSYLAAVKVGLKEDKNATDSDVSTVVAVPEVSSNNDSLGTVATDKTLMLDKVDTSITITATPASGCHFVKWLVTDSKTGTVSEKATASITETVNNNTRYSYKALFAKDAEATVSLDKTYVTMTAGDTAAQTLTATVTNATDTRVTWSSDIKEVATVADGVITAVGAGEATITATSVEDSTKAATCTVIVNAAPSTETLKALVTEAENKKDMEKMYSTVSRKNLAEVWKNNKDSVLSVDASTIKEAENNLRTALDNLEVLYKVQIDCAENVTVTPGDNGQVYTEGEKKIVYVPLLGQITVKTNATNTAGTSFSGWTLNGKKLSKSTSYTFYVIGNMEITPEYSSEEAEPEVNIFCTTKYNTTAGKLSFIAKRSVDKAYRVLEHGVVITDETGWNGIYNENPDALIKGATRTRKSVAKGTANIGTYEAKLAAGKNERWYGRSYVTYTDGETTYTVYSEIAQYPINQ